MRLLILAYTALAAACTATPEPAPAPASVAATATPGKSCTGPQHDDFDFWIGDWDVFAGNGVRAGENAITREEDGCLLVERWTGANGVTGQSYNFVDPATHNWRQVWISAGAVIDYSGGLTESGSMRLEGTITYQSGGPAIPFTGEWTTNADGTVTQHFEQFDAATGSWSPWFTGTYFRKTVD